MVEVPLAGTSTEEYTPCERNLLACMHKCGQYSLNSVNVIALD